MENIFYILDKDSVEFNRLISNPITKETLFNIIKPDFPEYQITNLDQLLEFDNHIQRFSLCIQNDIVIANAIGGPPYVSPADIFYISLVRTHVDYQGLGLCQKVMYNLVESYWDYENKKVRDDKKIRLEVLEDNAGAIACYKKIGFLEIAGPVQRMQGTTRIIWMQLDVNLYINYFIKTNLIKLVTEVNKNNNNQPFNQHLINDIKQKIIYFLQ